MAIDLNQYRATIGIFLSVYHLTKQTWKNLYDSKYFSSLAHYWYIFFHHHASHQYVHYYFFYLPHHFCTLIPYSHTPLSPRHPLEIFCYWLFFDSHRYIYYPIHLVISPSLAFFYIGCISFHSSSCTSHNGT